MKLGPELLLILALFGLALSFKSRHTAQVAHAAAPHPTPAVAEARP
jgi:hypothetical protein